MTKRCNCNEITATGCLCHVETTDAFTASESGTQASPWTFAPIFDDDADNLLTCTLAGLGAFAPDFLVNPPACRVYASFHHYIPESGSYALAFNLERYDTHGMHDNVSQNDRITFTVAGVYVVTASVTWEGNNQGERRLDLVVNGSATFASDERESVQTDDFDHSIETIYEFDVGDYIQVRALQNSSADPLRIFSIGNKSPEFAVMRVA